MKCNTRRPRRTWTVVEEAIANLAGQLAIPGPDRRRHELDIAALPSQAAHPDAEMREYGLLRSGAVKSFEAGSLPGLAMALVKARIARRWTQRRLAEELSMAEQQGHNGLRLPASQLGTAVRHRGDTRHGAARSRPWSRGGLTAMWGPPLLRIIKTR